MQPKVDPKKVSAVLTAVLSNVKGDERAGGWKLILDVPEDQGKAIATAVEFYKKMVHVVIVPVEE